MNANRVITEREVHRAAREGKTTLDTTGAVVTPAARDAAKRAGIELQSKTPAPAAPPSRSAGGPVPVPRPAPPKPSAVKPSGPTAPKPPDAKSAASPPSASGASTPRRVAIGADHGGVAMKEVIAKRLRETGAQVTDHGTNSTQPVDYPDIAVLVARDVAAGKADVGIMIDGAGIGSCMAANKIPGVRAAMCYDLTTAANAREHNDANVLTLGGGLIGARLAVDIVDRFLSTAFAGGRHTARVDKIKELDR